MESAAGCQVAGTRADRLSPLLHAACELGGATEAERRRDRSPITDTNAAVRLALLAGGVELSA